MKLEINRGEMRKFTNMLKLNNIISNNQRVKEKITRGIKKYRNLSDAIKENSIKRDKL